MKTKAPAPGSSLFLVLIPHRDAGGPVLSLKSRLFREGLAGAWSFPALAPLARLGRPLDRAALRELAVRLRSLLGTEKITGRAWDGLPLPGGTGLRESAADPLRVPRLWGLLLDMPGPSSLMSEGDETPVFGKKRPIPLEKPLLAAALLRRADAALAAEKAAFFDPPSVSFRAAALANMRLRPLAGGEENISFAWELGEPVWLPRPKRKGHG